MVVGERWNQGSAGLGLRLGSAATLVTTLTTDGEARRAAGAKLPGLADAPEGLPIAGGACEMLSCTGGPPAGAPIHCGLSVASTKTTAKATVTA
jgi:hypothetical protein